MRKSLLYNWWLSGGAPTQSEATAFFSRMSGLADPVPSDYQTRYNNVIYWLKNTLSLNGTTSIWEELDALVLQGTYSETASLQNLVQDLHNQTIFNGHASDFTVNEGGKGNGTNYRRMTGFNPGDGGTYKFTANSASMGFCSLSDQAGTVQDLSSLGAGGTSGSYLRAKQVVGSQFDFDGVINITGQPSVNITRTAPLSIGTYEIRKTAAGAVSAYFNGVQVWSATGLTDTAIINREFAEFCANANGSYSQFSNKAHSFTWFGSGQIDSNVLLGILQKYWFKPINNTNSNLGKRIIVTGDSQVGNLTSTTTSVQSQSTRSALTTLGAGWIGTQLGVPSRQIEETQFGVTPAINDGLNTEIIPFRNTYLDKDIVIIFAGTNDLASRSTITGAIVKTRIDTFRTAVRAAGFKVVIVGVPDRGASFLNSQTESGFDTARADLRTLMIADFTVSTATPNVYLSTDGQEAYCDLFADSRFQDASDTTYYNADLIHLNVTGHTIVGTDFMAPAVLLL